MTDLSPRQLIRAELINWFAMLRDGDTVTTDECVKRVNRQLQNNGHHKRPPETIKRYMRELRTDGTIDYVFVGPKSKKSIRVVK